MKAVNRSPQGIQVYSAITKSCQNLETRIDINLRRDLLLLPLHRPHHLLQLPLQVHHRLANVDNRLRLGYIFALDGPFFTKRSNHRHFSHISEDWVPFLLFNDM